MAIFYTILFFLLAIIFGIGNEGNFSLKNIIIVLVFVSVIKFIYGIIKHLNFCMVKILFFATQITDLK